MWNAEIQKWKIIVQYKMYNYFVFTLLLLFCNSWDVWIAFFFKICAFLLCSLVLNRESLLSSLVLTRFLFDIGSGTAVWGFRILKHLGSLDFNNSLRCFFESNGPVAETTNKSEFLRAANEPNLSSSRVLSRNLSTSPISTYLRHAFLFFLETLRFLPPIAVISA